MISRLGAAIAALALTGVAAPAFAHDPAPWIEDARQIRAALGQRYANLDWLTVDRGLNLDTSFKTLETGLAKTTSDAEARALVDRALSSLADGHVQMDWSPAAPAPKVSALAAPPCADQRPFRPRPPVASGLPGWTPLDTGEGAREFPGGLVTVEGRKIGVVQINIFMADPAVCEAAAAKLKLPLDKPCDKDCDDRLDTAVYQELTDRFAARLAAVKAADAQVLMIDLAGNGGGREWAEIAARMVTPIRLKSAPMRLVRSPQAADNLDALALDIEMNVGEERGAAKAALLAEAKVLRDRAAQARKPCVDGQPCALLVDAGYSSGVRASGDPVALAGKPWGQSVFRPLKWTWREGVWSGR